MFDTIVIGAGPAGLTSALYLKRAGKNVLVLEGKTYGGQIINASLVENYPGLPSVSGFDFATNLYNQVKELGVEVKFEAVVSVDKDLNVKTTKDTYKAKSIIIATGTQNRKLEIPNEDELVGRGVSYCATCDGNFYKGKDVAVVGGGNTALEDALYLSDIANHVYLIHRRDTFRGEQYIEELKKKENVEFVLNSKVVKLNSNDKLESIDVDTNGEIKNIKVDGLFVAVGQVPNNEIFKGLIEMDSYGYIISFDNVHTNVDKIYVAGDTRVKDLRQLTTAVSDGAIAASTALKEMER